MLGGAEDGWCDVILSQLLFLSTACRCLQVRKLRFKAEEFRSLQQSASRRGKVLGFLLDLKNSGEVPGIMGRLVM